MTRRKTIRGLGDLYHRRVAMEAMTLASIATKVPLAELLARKRTRARVAFARQLAMYLSHVAGRMSLGEIAHEFERDRTTVAHACHSIEDRRECPIFDAQIDILEKELSAQIARIIEDARRRPARYLEYKGLVEPLFA